MKKISTYKILDNIYQRVRIYFTSLFSVKVSTKSIFLPQLLCACCILGVLLDSQAFLTRL